MGIKLAEGEIGSFQECVHKDLLTYVSYPAFKGASRCFAYPQFLIEDETFTLLENSAFPDNGCLPMVVSSSTPHELKDMVGNIVVMTVNDEHPGRNRNYPEHEQSQYNSIIDPYFAKGASSVEFMPLSRHPLSGLMVQVLETQESIDFGRSLKQPVHLYSAVSLPQTKLSLVQQDGRYYGPFETVCLDGNAVQLKASNAFDLRIGSFDADMFTFSLDIVDDSENLVAQFVSADELSDQFAECEDAIDWISDKELLDALGRVMASGELALTKAQITTLKSEIAACLEEQAKIKLTPERRDRIVGLLDTYRGWSSLPDAVKNSILQKADPKQVAEYVLSNEHFRAFYDKVIENDQVRERVEHEKARYGAEAAEAKAEADKAAAELSRVKDELSRFDDELDARRSRIEEEMASQVERAQRQRDDLLEEVGALSKQKEELEAGKTLVQQQIDSAVSGLTDGAAVMEKVLENETLKQVLAAVEGTRKVASEARDLASVSFDMPISPDEGNDPQAILAFVGDVVRNSYGRDMNANEIANILICLTQGYITTFAGLPGTGKTSLVNIFAEVLGLKNRAASRFLEVPVEKGWTSYKDFIGYYNPFTESLEKSNPAMFDALAQLSAEAEEGLADSKVAPFLFLLDEANLSSIEHYWSPFLRACDSYRAGSFDLSLGGSKTFSVPHYARFVATVNFDHTTEELSPRFLDRSWVVTLDPQTIVFGEDEPVRASFDPVASKAYSYQALQRAFGPKAGALLSVELKAKFKEVLDLCARHRFSVSPRSQRMMLDYACTASNLMDCSSAQDQYAPVDYAVAQKVLPALSGTEERLGGLLEELSLVGGLPLTKARVEHMLEAGEDSGYYQYFA